MLNEDIIKVIEEVIGNKDDAFWINLVSSAMSKLLGLSERKEFTMSSLVDEKYSKNEKFMKDLYDVVIQVCDKLNITLESKGDGVLVKKTVSDEVLNSVPESLKEFVYVSNGKFYAKQRLPRELEDIYKNFINGLK